MLPQVDEQLLQYKKGESLNWILRNHSPASDVKIIYAPKYL